jgi:hypothetical protein
MNMLDPHTSARRHLANATVAWVGHKDVAVCINGHARGKPEAGVGPNSVGISSVGAADPTRQRGNRCRRNTQYRNHPRPPPKPKPIQQRQQRVNASLTVDVSPSTLQTRLKESNEETTEQILQKKKNT